MKPPPEVEPYRLTSEQNAELKGLAEAFRLRCKKLGAYGQVAFCRAIDANGGTDVLAYDVFTEEGGDWRPSGFAPVRNGLERR